jgi:hypothetical protein
MGEPSAYQRWGYVFADGVNCVGVRVVSFRSSIAHPAYTPVYASLCRSR